MHFNPYGGNAAELAAALVNLALDAAPSAVAQAMAAHGSSRPAPDERQAVTLLAWARQLEGVFGARCVEAQVDIANELLTESASTPRVSQHHGKPPHLHYIPDDADTVSAVKGFTAAGVAMVICSSEPHRLGRCAREGCLVVYVDTSRNGRRRFCSTRCATRVHVADHRSRAKHRPEHPDRPQTSASK